MSKSNHLHEYKKVDLARKKDKPPYLVYKCQVLACPHYIPLTLAEGKVCKCSRCHQPMIITKATLTRSNGGPMLFPHCEDCTVRKDSDAIANLAGIIERKVK
jgi:hypothetical protein